MTREEIAKALETRGWGEGWEVSPTTDEPYTPTGREWQRDGWRVNVWEDCDVPFMVAATGEIREYQGPLPASEADLDALLRAIGAARAALDREGRKG